MTILTNTNVMTKKPDDLKAPLVLDNCVCEEGGAGASSCTTYPEPMYLTQQWHYKHSLGALLCMTIVALLVATSGITTGLMLYRHHLKGTHRYQGYCSIPIDTRQLMQLQAGGEQLIEPNYREHRIIPLEWSSSPNFQVISTTDVDDSDDFVNALREELEIDDDVERIQVQDNGRVISFVHDFAENVTSIIDSDRCFITTLEPGLVLPPELLMVGIERGDGFDVSRVRTTLRAVLPALRDLVLRSQDLDERCDGKPVYRLEKEEEPIIRKRSADALPYDYMQFAGRHVQEIEIANLAELLGHEKKQV